MSKPSNALRKVGNFFGVTKSTSEDLLRNKAERQIKEGEFGITLKRSSSKQNREQHKFVNGARKVLSRIGAFQKFEESQEHLDVTDKRRVNQSDEPVAGTSKTVENAWNQPLSLTTPKQNQSLCKQSVYNKLYTEDDEEDTDIDTGRETKLKTKPKVTFEVVNSVDTQTIKSDGFENEPDLKSGEIVAEKGRTVFSDPYIAYQMFNNESSKEMPSEEKDNKTKLIFFDELVKPYQRLQKNELDIPKYSYDSLTRSMAYTGNKTTTRNDNIRSSPDIIIDQTTTATEDLFTDKISTPETSETNPEDKVKEDKTLENLGKDNLDSVNEAKPYYNMNKEVSSKLSHEDVVYGKEALKHYKFYLQIERKVEKQRLKEDMESKLLEYDWKLSAIDEMIAMAKDYYTNPNSKNAARWKDLKRKVKKSSSHQIGHTEHRRKLGLLPDYRPFFTYFIMFAQLVSFIVICGLHGFTLVGIEPKLTVESDIQTFIGMETIHKWTAPNVWIGPSEKSLIGVGGVFAPCMRSDIQIQFEQSKQNYSTDLPLGCCEVTNRNVAGTTTQAECDHLTEGIGTWNANVTCNKRPVNQAGTRHNMKPCCLGIKGQCRLMSHKHCVFLGGKYYLFGPEHCSQVMCLENICHPGRVTASKMLPWQPESPAQWWRVPLSVLYHHGIIQFVVVMVIQWFLLTQIEITAGWFRMLIIYLISGSMALLTSSIMLPYQVHVGGVGAVCGMLGVVIVELLHFWKLVHKPLLEILKLSIAIMLLFLLGTLPYLDIFGMITGIVSGTLCGVIFLPYVTFGKWHRHMRIILVVSALGLLILICYFLLHLFSTVQSVENCEGCKRLNCVSYTEKMCDTSLWHQF